MKKLIVLALLLGIVPANAFEPADDAVWQSFIDQADTWSYSSDCLPALKICRMFVTSPAKDDVWVQLIAGKDVNEHVIWRLVCTHNTLFPQKRRCLNIDTHTLTTEMLDVQANNWVTVASEFVGKTPANTSGLVRQWDEPTKNQTIIRRQLYTVVDGTMNLLATEYDTVGTVITSSACRFNQFGLNECINNAGQRYQLKPTSITSFYSMKGTR